MLRVVLPVCPKDYKQMVRLLTWILELNPKGLDHACLMSFEVGTSKDEIRELAEKCFTAEKAELTYQVPTVIGWPAAPNWAWTNAASAINRLDEKLPWLWLEADATPLVAGWLDAIEAEYQKGGKPFMGHIVERPSKKTDREFDRHMNGVAVYPPDACLHSSRAMRTRAAPWDIVLSEDCIGRVHGANWLMEHMQRFTGVVATCRDRKILDHFIRSGTVLFHGCNDGSVIALLRGLKPEEPPPNSVVKLLEMGITTGHFDESESMWQQEAVDLQNNGHPFISFEECTNAKVPSFRDQTTWRTGIFHELEYRKNLVHLNPGIAQDGDGKTWLVSRRWEKISSPAYNQSNWHSTLQATQIEIGERVKVIEGSEIELDFGTPPMIEHEDPRVVFSAGQFAVSYCTWEKQLRVAHGRQGFATFDKQWNLIGSHFPDYGKNKDKTEADFETEEDPLKPKWEKNWIWFVHKGHWHVVYSFSPFRIYRLGRYISEPCGAEPKIWKHGIVRGGTPPVFHAGLYWTFFHSSMPWRGRQKRYYMGAYAFNEQFEIARMTPEPLLSGSDRDARMLGGPLVIFPGGAIVNRGKWFVVGGCNDEQCFWIEIPHMDLEKVTIPC